MRRTVLVLSLVLAVGCRCDEERLAVACSDEVCDGVDNDCDGEVDDGLPSVTCGTGACLRTVATCTDGVVVTCAPGEPTDEVCNGVDDDCDGLVDDALAASRCGVGACAREVVSCTDGVVVTCEPGAPATETCDGTDEDCDGDVDEELVTTCGLGACVRTVDQCGPACEPGPSAPEVCNGIDDDCDSAVDQGVCVPPSVACSALVQGRVGEVIALGAQVVAAESPTMGVWDLDARPPGSSATLTAASATTASFVPDVVGTYRVRFCATDAADLEGCCVTEVVVTQCISPPAPPVGTACGTSWDGRPIVTFDPVAPGHHHDLVDVSGSTLAVARAGENWLRPAARIAAGGPPPGIAVQLGVRSCLDDDATCCSAPAPVTVSVIEACSTPVPATTANVVLSEYVVNGEGSCSPADCFVCQAGESIEITNLSNCPVSLAGTHFKYRNAAAASGSLRWMNFGPADLIPARGVYVAIRGRMFAPTCAASLPLERADLYGLKVSTLAMQGPNTCSGWFNNTGGGQSEMQLAQGTVASQADLMFTSANVLSRIAPYVSSSGACVSTGFDALDSCGSVVGGSEPAATLDPNQLGRLWHPCDEVPGAVPACVRD